MKLNRVILISGILFFFCFTKSIESREIVSSEDNRTMVAYQYLTKCPICGYDKMEGYYSLIDGYTEEICDECGFHTNIDAYSDHVSVIKNSDKE